MPNDAINATGSIAMKAVLCKSLTGPDGLIIVDLPDPTAGHGQVVVKVRAAALNFFDTLIIAGKYQTKPTLPFSPCGEIAGVIQTVGEGVDGWRPGDRVMAYLGYGGARERVAVEAGRLVAIPDGVSDAVASGLSITYGTAIHGLRDRANLQAGETVAILGASGGAGLAAVEIAKLLGARVIAVASDAEKLEACRDHGADETVLTTTPDFKEALRGLTSGQGVDVVYDCVGGSLAEPAVRALAWNGRYLVIGFASGEIPRLPLNLLLLRGACAVGVFWGEAVARDLAGHRANQALVMDGVCDGRLQPRVYKILPLEAIRDGLELLAERKVIGKVVLEV